MRTTPRWMALGIASCWILAGCPDTEPERSDDDTADDHNIEVSGAEVYDHFVDFDAHDLRLLASAPAVDAGTADLAPADDHRGAARDATPDVGAFEYVPGLDD